MWPIHIFKYSYDEAEQQLMKHDQKQQDVVPLQPTNICDNGLAALRHFGQIQVNIVQKATTLFRIILAFTVRIELIPPRSDRG